MFYSEVLIIMRAKIFTFVSKAEYHFLLYWIN